MLRLLPFLAALSLTTLTLSTVLASPAQAGGYTLTDIVSASAQGVPEDTILTMVDSPAAPWVVDDETAVRLLRSGVSYAVVHALSGGTHPTPIELEAAKLPGPAWDVATSSSLTTAGLEGHAVRLTRRDGSTVEGTLLAWGQAQVVVQTPEGAVVVPVADVAKVARTDAPEPPPAPPAPPDSVASADSIPPAEAPPPAEPSEPSEYQRLIAAERGYSPRSRPITNLHGERYSSANRVILAGVGETAVGLALLASLAPHEGDSTDGLRLAGTGLCLLGSGSVIGGSLVAADALHDDGFDVTTAPGWIGLGLWGAGVLAYAGNTLVQGGPEPFTAGAVLTTSGTALGLIQGGVSVGDRKRTLRSGRGPDVHLAPVAQAGGGGLRLTGTF